VAAILLIGWQYSAAPGFLKRRMAGTAAGGAAMGFLAYFAGFAGQAGGAWTHPGPGPVIFAVTMSAWMAFVGAPAKDLPDVRGDADAGRRTVAVLWGERATRRIIASSAIVIAIAFCGAASSNARLLAWPAATLGAGAVAAAVLSLSPLSEGSRSRRRLPYRAFMVTQYVTNACLLITVIRLATPLTSVLPQ
jgi:4-hydroxybenzoate polyprenyltransferase